MKNIVLTLAATFLISLCCPAQTVIKGTIRDADTGEELSFATIGVIGTSVGCVADSKGNYTFTIPEDTDYSQTLRVSLISHHPVTMSVREFVELHSHDIALICKPILLKEHVVIPAKYKKRALGSDYSRGNAQIMARDTTRGFECGVLFTIKKPSLLQTVTVAISRNEYKMLTFRVNVYKRTSDGNFENIQTQPIYAQCPETFHLVYVDIDVLDHNIMLEGDILVSFEHVEDDNNGRVFFPSGLFGTTSLGRRAGEDVWTEYFLEAPKMKGKFPLSITVLEKK